jgi:aminoglycoside 3-N-acetyltransferase
MSESYDAPLPHTIHSLAEAFAACGLAAGQTVVVHSSMSKIGGYIVGGAEAVIWALIKVLGTDGTLMMPTHTTENTDPANWRNPPVPESYWPVIRAHAPPFNPRITKTRQMGQIAELFRTWPGVRRSAHPVGSFAAWGKHADYLTRDHELLKEFGDTSPIGRLYDLDGYVLLLGVPHHNNTSLHLAEHRANWPGKRYIQEGTAMLVDGERRWVSFQMLDLESADFDLIGDSYEDTHGIRRGQVGNAEVRFMKQRPLIDFAIEWMQKNRK